MKKKKFLPLLLFGLMATTALAEDEDYTMYVNLTDGSQVQFVLSKQFPFVYCCDGKMIINYDNATSNITFERDQIKDLTYGFTSNIKSLTAASKRVKFTVMTSGELKATGLKNDDSMSVYSLDGKMMSAAISRNGTEAIIDLRSNAHGVYIISINNSFTFKYMKP